MVEKFAGPSASSALNYPTGVQGCFAVFWAEFFFSDPWYSLAKTAARKVRFACARRRRGHRIVKEEGEKISLLAMCAWLAHLVAASRKSICRASCRPFFRGYSSRGMPIPRIFNARQSFVCLVNTREITRTLLPTRSTPAEN